MWPRRRFRDLQDERRRFRADRLTHNGASDSNPTWSHDGKKIAFESTRDGNSEIYTMKANGDNPTRRTVNATNDGAPDWQPYFELVKPF